MQQTPKKEWEPLTIENLDSVSGEVEGIMNYFTKMKISNPSFQELSSLYNIVEMRMEEMSKFYNNFMNGKVVTNEAQKLKSVFSATLKLKEILNECSTILKTLNTTNPNNPLTNSNNSNNNQNNNNNNNSNTDKNKTEIETKQTHSTIRLPPSLTYTQTNGDGTFLKNLPPPSKSLMKKFTPHEGKKPLYHWELRDEPKAPPSKDIIQSFSQSSALVKSVAVRVVLSPADYEMFQEMKWKLLRSNLPSEGIHHFLHKNSGRLAYPVLERSPPHSKSDPVDYENPENRNNTIFLHSSMPFVDRYIQEKVATRNEHKGKWVSPTPFTYSKTRPVSSKNSPLLDNTQVETVPAVFGSFEQFAENLRKPHIHTSPSNKTSPTPHKKGSPQI